MKIIADTNVLLRAVVGDDAKQSRAAIRAMEQAETVVVSQHALCELVWVLDRRYGVSRADIAAAIRQLRDTKNVVLDRPAVEAGLAMLDASGDFADGVIAYKGAWLTCGMSPRKSTEKDFLWSTHKTANGMQKQ